MHTIDYMLCGAYLVLIVGGGAWIGRGQRTARDYFLAGGSAGLVLVGASLMATMASSIGFLGGPAAGVQAGYRMLYSLVAIPIAYPIITRVVIPFYRRLQVYTVYEYIEERFDLSVRLLGSGLFIAWRITWMAVSLYVPAKVLAVATGGAVPAWVGVVGLGVLAASYTTVGGMRAVLWTDFAQALVMFGGISVALYILRTHVPGGLMHLAAADAPLRLPESAAASENGWLHRLIYNDFTVPAIIVAFTLDKLGYYGVDQMMVQRYLVARSERVARTGFALNCLLFPLFFALMISVGVALQSYRASAGLPADIRPDAIFPYFITHHMPPGAAGLLLAGLMAAAMSSIDSAVNACNSAVMNDFYHRLRGGHANLGAGTADMHGAHPLRLVRLSGVVVMLVAIALGCVVGQLGDVFRLALALVNAFLGPLLAMFILARWSARAHARGVFWGVCLGVGLVAVVVLSEKLAALAGDNVLRRVFAVLDVGFLWTSAVGFLAALAPGWLLSLVLPRRRAA
ncbi:MAG: sodium:solute symporter family transporter [Candidatus Hydrogenedentota bacterium]